MSPLDVRSKVYMAPFHVRSKVCIAPINVPRKVCKFAPHIYQLLITTNILGVYRTYVNTFENIFF